MFSMHALLVSGIASIGEKIIHGIINPPIHKTPDTFDTYLQKPQSFEKWLSQSNIKTASDISIHLQSTQKEILTHPDIHLLTQSHGYENWSLIQEKDALKLFHPSGKTIDIPKNSPLESLAYRYCCLKKMETLSPSTTQPHSLQKFSPTNTYPLNSIHKTQYAV